MTFKFKMPDVGEGMAEGEIVKWLVAEGDTVEEEDSVAEIQNDKSVEEIATPVSGTIKKILVAEGTVATVGDVLIEIDAPGHESEDEEEAAPSTPSSPAMEEKATDPATSGSTGSSSIYKFKMPDVGEGMAEGEIVKWLIAEGDTIEEEDSIAEIQNDKSVEEIATPVSGTVKSILVSEGTVASVGDVLVEIDAPGYVDESAPAAEAPVSTATESKPAASTPQTGERNERVLAMPSVRQFARDNDVEIALVTPSGKGGRTTKADVQSFMSGETAAPAKQETAAATPAKETASKKEAAPAAKPFSSSMEESETREKMTGMRKAIAKAMVNSKHTAPHVTLHDEVEVSQLWDHRKKFKTIAADKGTKLTFLPYVVKALAATVKAFPVMNASIDDATQEIVYKNYINIGIATDTDNGLYVPNVKNADAKGMFTIADEINDKAAQAQAGKLAAADMRDGSISISNIGSVGGGWFTPVINYPEVAILGVGTIAQQPVVNAEGEIVVGRMMKLSLSFDHRIVDGATAQKAMNNIKRLLADPELLLMEG